MIFSNLTEAKICWHQENESSNSWWTMCVKRRGSRLVDICSVMFTWEYETKLKKAARIYDEGWRSVSRNWCVLGTSMYYKVNCRLLFTPVATQTRREITFSPLFRVKIKSDQQRVQPPSVVLSGIYMYAIYFFHYRVTEIMSTAWYPRLDIK